VAGDGKVLYSFDGDIFVRDSPTAAKTPLIVGPTIDETPAVSNDGSKLVFSRHEDGGASSMWIANVDGSASRRLDIPFAISWFEWSPNGTDLYVANEDGRSTMAIVPTDGSPSTTLDLGMPVQVPIHRPGYDDQILCKGQDSGGNWGFYMVGRDGLHPQRPGP
jgi:Tol biopolymer transport system component